MSRTDSFMILDTKGNSKQAVVGIGLRMPQAANLEEFWEIIINRVDLKSKFPQKRALDILSVKEAIWHKYSPRLNEYLGVSGYFLDNLADFDYDFFGILPSEAIIIDPRQRLFLEIAWDAIEMAGHNKDDMLGSDTGVFVAYNPYPYFEYTKLLSSSEATLIEGNNPPNLGYRLSYWLDLKGPVISYNTTCSSSLVALISACRAIEQGDCKQAIVASIQCELFPFWKDWEHIGIESPNGRCLPFDSRADGTVFGEGAVTLFLKPLKHVKANKSPILGIMEGGAINADGRSNGLSAPNPHAQSEVIKLAWKRAGIPLQNANFIEAHGTGTQLGDPIECQGIKEAFQGRSAENPLFISSVKSIFGHCGDCAGLVGVVKALESMRHRKLPKQLNFNSINPAINLDGTNISIVTEDLDLGHNPLTCGVSSFGVSGTNAHIVLSAYFAKSDVEKEERSAVVLSEYTYVALSVRIQEMIRYIKQNPGESLKTIAHTLWHKDVGRPVRLVIICDTTKVLLSRLKRVSEIREFEIWPSDLEECGVLLTGWSSPPTHTLTLIQKAYKFVLTGDRSLLENEFQNTNYQIAPLPPSEFNRKHCWPNLAVHDAVLEDKIYYDLKWVENTNQVAFKTDLVDGTWLIFSNESILCTSVVALLKQQGANVIELRKGDQYDFKGNIFYVNLTNKHDFEKVGRALAKTALQGVLHFWQVESELIEASLTTAGNAFQDLGVMSLFYFSREVMPQLYSRHFPINYISTRSKRVLDSDELVLPERSAALGFLKVLSQEYPNLTTYFLDIIIQENQSKLSESILNECMKPHTKREHVIAFRSGRQYYEVLERMPEANAIVKNRSFREDGVYIIFGGTGYLASLLLNAFSSLQGITFHLISRNSLPKNADQPLPILESIERAKKNGAKIFHWECDVTQIEDLYPTLDMIKLESQYINGIIFAVKDLAHQLIQVIPEERFKSGLQNRILAIKLLAKYFSKNNLDFFLIYSSISSIMGAKTASECASVNQYLDHTNEVLRQQGLPVNILNLSLVNEKGKGMLGKTAIPPLTPEEFIKSTQYVIEKDIQFLLSAKFNFNEVKELLPVFKIRFSNKILEEVIKKACYSPAHSVLNTNEDDFESIVKDAWFQTLGMEIVDLDKNFFDLGATSLNVLKLSKILSQRANIMVDVTDLFGRPTISDQVLLLKEKTNAKSGLKVENNISEVMELLKTKGVDIDEMVQKLLGK